MLSKKQRFLTYLLNFSNVNLLFLILFLASLDKKWKTSL